MRERWRFGFLGFIGLLYLPKMSDATQGEASPWYFLHVLWFGYFYFFTPKRR